MTHDPVSGTNHFWGFGDNTLGEIGITTTVGTGTTVYGCGNVDNFVSIPTNVQFCTRCQREVQLGSSGVFTAQCNGTLYLYFNGDLTDGGGYFQDYGGSYTVSLTGTGLTNLPVTVWGTNYQGLAVGTVTVGNTYTFTASGYCTNNSAGFAADPDGRDPSGNLVNCSSAYLNITNAVCPMWQCFSLVGRIQ